MAFPIMIAQASLDQHGWLTGRLLNVFTGSAEWVLWLLVMASVISIAVIVERAIYFATHQLKNGEDLVLQIAKGQFDAVREALQGKRGMEAEVLREGLEWSVHGSASVEQVVDATIARLRPRYERTFSFLGTLGANAPFVGLFGTVLGVIKAFGDLGATGARGAEVQQTVMTGISEALVATAVGLAVAIPAVIAYNIFTRQLKHILARSTALGHALVGHLKAQGK